MQRITCALILCLSTVSITTTSFAYQTLATQKYRPTYYRNTNTSYTPDYYHRTSKASKPAQQPPKKFISGYRFGFDVMGGTISNPTTIKYGITDLYTNQKTSEYSFDNTLIGAGFNFGLQHYQTFESEKYTLSYLICSWF